MSADATMLELDVWYNGFINSCRPLHGTEDVANLLEYVRRLREHRESLLNCILEQELDVQHSARIAGNLSEKLRKSRARVEELEAEHEC